MDDEQDLKPYEGEYPYGSKNDGFHLHDVWMLLEIAGLLVLAILVTPVSLYNKLRNR